MVLARFAGNRVDPVTQTMVYFVENLCIYIGEMSRKLNVITI